MHTRTLFGVVALFLFGHVLRIFMDIQEVVDMSKGKDNPYYSNYCNNICASSFSLWSNVSISINEGYLLYNSVDYTYFCYICILLELNLSTDLHYIGNPFILGRLLVSNPSASYFSFRQPTNLLFVQPFL